MKIIALLAFIVFTTISCANTGDVPKQEQSISVSDKIIAKRDLYLELIKEVQDEHGFIDSIECDSLLWTSLAQYSGVGGIDLLAARNEETGQWFRTPSKDCHDKYLRGETGFGNSKSDISKDMFTGLFWAAAGGFVSKEVMVETWKYGKKNNWVMGRGPYSRTWLSINLQNTLAILTNKPKSELPEIWHFINDSYSDVHITIVHILLRGQLEGKISKKMFNYLEDAYKEWPDNGFFAFALSLYKEGIDYSHMIEKLNDEHFFPSNRLPTTEDRCSNYIWGDREHDYDACPPEDKYRVWSGVDLLFIAKLLNL